MPAMKPEIKPEISSSCETNSIAEGTSIYLFDGSEELITEVCNELNSEWEFIGAFLCIDFKELNNIAENEKDCEERLRKVFQIKIGSEEGLTWASIERALKCVGKISLISKFEKKYESLTKESASNNLEKPNWTYFMAYLSYVYISGFWKKFARYLGIEERTIDAIGKDTRYHTFQSKAFGALQKAYDMQEDGNFNWNTVSKALEGCRHLDIIKEIKRNKEFLDITK